MMTLAVVQPAIATTYYVDAACGDDSWSGTNTACAAPDGPKATIQAAIDTASDGDEVVLANGVYAGPGNTDVRIDAKQLVVRSAGGPQACVIDGGGTARAFELLNNSLPVTLEGLTISNGSSTAGGAGGGVRIVESSAILRDCILSGNTAAIAGALHHSGAGTLRLADCSFVNNTAEVGAGAIFVGADHLVVTDCVFADNDGGQGPGAVGATTTSSTYVNCVFSKNTAIFLGGGLVESATGGSTLINCVFSRNAANMGGGIMTAGAYSLINCTFSSNQGMGLTVGSGGATLTNCIAWGNQPGQVDQACLVTWSDIQGGFPGIGNFDVNPFFVQPGTDDVRLSFGSPCINTGYNAALPADDLDIDGDGDVSETIPWDLGHNPRIQEGIVDRGAWEGGYTPGDPAAGENDLDEGDFAVLVPEGGPLDPVATAAALVLNINGGDNASALVTQIDWEFHEEAGGYSEQGSILALETSLADGHFITTMYIPFHVAPPGDIGGPNQADPDAATLTWYDPVAGNWALAVSGNALPSPGHAGPIGDRIFSTDPGNWGITTQPGDYGVFFNEPTGEAFAWANVDYAGDFGLGESSCRADCRQTPDGQVGIVDLLAMLSGWGNTGGNPCDLDGDGVIGLADFVALLEAWGPCPLPSQAPPGTGGPIGARLAMLRAAWGPCEPGCPLDLDNDGRVGIGDYLALLDDSARWQAASAWPESLPAPLSTVRPSRRSTEVAPAAARGSPAGRD